MKLSKLHYAVMDNDWSKLSISWSCGHGPGGDMQGEGEKPSKSGSTEPASASQKKTASEEPAADSAA